jgi:hypothetical protein
MTERETSVKLFVIRILTLRSTNVAISCHVDIRKGRPNDVLLPLGC